jgi:hypothetical protein
LTKLDHGRPILKTIDALRRERGGHAQVVRPEMFPSVASGPAATDERDQRHQRAVETLKHFGQHNDIRPVAKFIDSIPDTPSKTALVKWFCAYGRMSVTTEMAIKFDREKKTRLGNAMDTPYWKFMRRRATPLA